MATSPGSPGLPSREGLRGIFFSLLGPLEVRSAAEPVMAGPLKQRIALAILLCHANKVVPVSDLSDAIWGTDTPRTAHKNLQVHISLLRGLLFPGDGAERLAYRYPGYRIQVGPAELDVLAYQQLVRDGRGAARHGDIQLAASTLHRALRMWRGDALADLASVPAVGAEAAHLNNHRAAVYEDWAEAELQLGNHALILEEIEEMVRRHPTRERLRRVQLLALSRSGRHVEALAEYDDLRVTLSREFGLEPSGALQHLYQAILSGQPGGGAARGSGRSDTARLAAAQGRRRFHRARGGARRPGGGHQQGVGQPGEGGGDRRPARDGQDHAGRAGRAPAQGPFP